MKIKMRRAKSVHKSNKCAYGKGNEDNCGDGEGIKTGKHLIWITRGLEKGSGNAGATNMSRTYGKAAGIATLAGDILKTVIPVLVAKLLVGEVLGYLTGLMCALGHAFPCYYKFKGGKCVAVTAAVLLIMEPLAFLFLFIIFAAVVLATKYVSLASIFTALISPVIIHNFIKNKCYGGGHIGIIFLIVQCLLVVFLHRENIKRLLNGKENKFAFKKKKTENNSTEK